MRKAVLCACFAALFGSACSQSSDVAAVASSSPIESPTPSPSPTTTREPNELCESFEYRLVFDHLTEFVEGDEAGPGNIDGYRQAASFMKDFAAISDIYEEPEAAEGYRLLADQFNDVADAWEAFNLGDNEPEDLYDLLELHQDAWKAFEKHGVKVLQTYCAD